MKNNILLKGLSGVLVAGAMASCSSDYLDLAPITSIDASMVETTVDGAQKALTGLYRSMWMGYDNFGLQMMFMQGEAWISTFYGDVFGVDAYYNTWDRGVYTGGILKWESMNESGHWYCQVGWQYAYNLIFQANMILKGIDTMEGSEQARMQIKAQALAMRAHAYTRLVQIYGPRWEDSKNESVYIAVLRTEPTTTDQDLSTYKEVMDQIYDDLDESLRLFAEYGFTRTATYEVDASVAKGMYARAAILRNDWQKAYDMASEARAAYPIMSGSEYKGGFAEPNGEWMWCNAPDDQGVGYWSWGAMYACNGAYVSYWGMGAGAINYDLYRKMDDNDIRRDLYLTPDYPDLKSPLRPASFWNGSIVDSSNMNLNAKNSNMKITVEWFGQDAVPNQDVSKWGYPYTLESGEGASSSIIVPFGAQYKFWGLGSYSVASYPFMRGAEMLLYQAEAAYHLNMETETASLLTELNSKRSAGYTCTKSGAELWEEYMASSRIELWGEGFSWFNAKRWNIPVERRPWIESDVDSNNMPATIAMVKQPSDNCGWVFAIPQAETRYNLAIDPSKLICQPSTSGGSDSGSGEDKEE